MLIKSIIQLLRPEQWVKNLFIFLPAFFNGHLWDIAVLLPCFTAFIALSFAASSIYCYNDICDINSDRAHVRKCKRPIASGTISIKTAYAVMLICVLFSMLVLFLYQGETKYRVFYLIATYYLINLAYSFKLKQLAIIDVMIISIGFVLRILIGGAATNIWLSEWIIMMTFLLALFLAFAKRRDDVVLYRETGVLPRKHISRYNLEFINQVMTLISTITIIAYIMYSLSADVMERFHHRPVYLTSVFVLTGIIRYLQITIVDLKSGNPVEILMHDRFIQFCVAGWMISFFVIIYL